MERKTKIYEFTEFNAKKMTEMLNIYLSRLGMELDNDKPNQIQENPKEEMNKETIKNNNTDIPLEKNENNIVEEEYIEKIQKTI